MSEHRVKMPCHHKDSARVVKKQGQHVRNGKVSMCDVVVFKKTN